MHIVRHLRGWIGAMCIAGSGSVMAAPVLTPPDPGIDALMQRYDGQVPGAAVLVLHDGKPVFRRGYGLAVLEGEGCEVDRWGSGAAVGGC